MPKCCRHFLRVVILLIVLVFIYSDLIAAPPINSIPVPQETLVVFWVRPSQVANDPQLKAMTSDLSIIFSNLQTIGLSPEDVDEAVLFTPFDLGWIYGSGGGFPQSLSSDGGLILKGKFNADSKYHDLKSKGWEKSQFDRKRVLFWTTGETFLCAPDGNECVATLAGDRLVIGGSPDVIKKVLNVAYGKTPSLDGDPFYQQISSQFVGNGNMAISLFTIATDQMRAMIKPPPANDDTTSASYRATIAAINAMRSYSNHVKELGLSVSTSAGGYQIDATLAFDGESSAALVSSLLQLSGGLVNFLPANNPARSIVAGLQVSHDGALLNLQSTVTRQQLNDIFMKRK
jgi:hypothetical protein